jgi:hypothetical protein
MVLFFFSIRSKTFEEQLVGKYLMKLFSQGACLQGSESEDYRVHVCGSS